MSILMTTSTKRSENKKEGIHYICKRGVLTIPPDDVTDMQTITIAISWESPVMVNSEIFHIIYSYVIMCINKLEDRDIIYKLSNLFHHVNIYSNYSSIHSYPH